MTNLPTEIIRTIWSFTKEWRFLHGRWMNLSPLFLLKAPKTFKSISSGVHMFFVEMQINSNTKFRLEYNEFMDDIIRTFRCTIKEIGGHEIELFSKAYLAPYKKN